ncbi:MAG: hypothetical protein MZV70_37195 [Desulfobacterales bacterium]|nr:hypothetical protein [Desulfobacterales bacterium]
MGFDETKAHAIEAGSDFFLMPSRFEPCGLNQTDQHALRHHPHRDRCRGLTGHGHGPR